MCRPLKIIINIGKSRTDHVGTSVLATLEDLRADDVATNKQTNNLNNIDIDLVNCGKMPPSQVYNHPPNWTIPPASTGRLDSKCNMRPPCPASTVTPSPLQTRHLQICLHRHTLQEKAQGLKCVQYITLSIQSLIHGPTPTG